jgi:hypothetical protein
VLPTEEEGFMAKWVVRYVQRRASAKRRTRLITGFSDGAN